MQHPPGVVHVILVRGSNQFPGVPGRVGCRNTEGPQQPLLAVGPVVGQGLAGPLTGAQHPPPGIPEVIGVVRFALAAPGGQAGPGILGLDAVAEPVGAPRGAWLVAQRLGQPGGMIGLRAGGGLVAAADLLGQAPPRLTSQPGDRP